MTQSRPGDQRDWRGERQPTRDDRHLAELQELCVAGLGVQALAAVAIALLVRPVAYHRLVFRRHQKEHLIRAANIVAILGLATVALAISAAVLLILSYVVPAWRPL